MRNFFLTLLLLLLNVVAWAQNPMEDVILLKTAEVIRGDIQENIENEYVIILLRDSTLATYNWADIHLITQEPRRNFERKKERGKTRKTSTGNRIGLIMDMGFSLNRSNKESVPLLNVGLIPAYSIGSVSIGIGSGFRVSLNSDGVLVPIYLDLRASTNNPIAPIFAAGLGTAFLISDTDLNGRIGYIKGGVKFANNNGGSFNILIGFDATPQLVPRTTRIFSRSIPTERFEDTSGLSVSLAISF